MNIPVPSFEYVHKSLFSDKLGSPTPGFMIGRDRIIEKLKTWLVKEKQVVVRILLLVIEEWEKPVSLTECSLNLLENHPSP